MFHLAQRHIHNYIYQINLGNRLLHSVQLAIADHSCCEGAMRRGGRCDVALSSSCSRLRSVVARCAVKSCFLPFIVCAGLVAILHSGMLTLHRHPHRRARYPSTRPVDIGHRTRNDALYEKSNPTNVCHDADFVKHVE